MADNFDLNRDITGLLGKCLGLLTPSGKIFLSVNTRRSSVTQGELEAELRPQSTATANVRVTDISEKIIDEDFKGKKTPKAFLLTL